MSEVMVNNRGSTAARLGAWLQPKYGLYLLILLTPILPQAPIEIGWLELLYIAVFGLTLGVWALEHGGWKGIWALRSSPVTWTVLFFLAICVASFPVALKNGTTTGEYLRGLIPYLNLLAFLVAATEFKTRRELLLFMGLSVVAGLILCAQGIQIILQNQLWVPRSYPDPKGLLPTVYVYQRLTWYFLAGVSPLLLTGFVIAAGFAAFARSKWVWLGATLAGAVLLMIVAWGWSRSAFLAIGAGSIGLLGLLLLKRQFKPARYALGALALAVLLNVAFYAAIQVPVLDIFEARVSQAAQAVATGGEETGIDENIDVRRDEFLAAFEAFKQQPIVGMGLGYHYAIRVPDVDTAEGYKVIKVPYTHNFVAYFIMTMGLLGTLAYGLMIAAGAWELGLGLIKHEPAKLQLYVIVGVSALVILVDALFFAVFRLITFNLFAGVALGCAIALRRHGPSLEA